MGYIDDVAERLEGAIVNFERSTGLLRAAIRATDTAHDTFGVNSINYEDAKSAESVAIEEVNIDHAELIALRREVASIRRDNHFP